MGISGLLPLLRSIHKPCNLKKFAGQTIGVDAYGWLHRGTVACSTDIALGKPTRKYIEFSMNRVRMLIHFGVTPYVVFDGDYLPGKAATEVDRAKRREESKKKGLAFYQMNKPSQAHLELQKAVDVTPLMARELIEELKKAGVQYVVAPYEADAQLVYLEKKGLIQGMLSEDSDLLVFGGRRLLTKLDQYGDCVEIDRADFTACRGISLVGWTDAEFRRMAILSGCDYLANISGMGLKNAYRLVRKYKTIEKIVRMLQFDGKFHVPAGYLEAFLTAELTFLHQRVFCPEQGVVVMLNEIEPGSQPKNLSSIGAEIDQATAAAVAKGDLDPVTKTSIVVPQQSQSFSRTPWSSKRLSSEGRTLSEVKGNKCINAIFKAKRIPLAELDPNTLKASPTQQRLLQEATESSWQSSPAPSVTPSQSIRGSSTSNAPPLSSSGLRNDDGATASSSSDVKSVKKRRLFHEQMDANGSKAVGEVQEVKSPFFTNSRDKIPVGKAQKNVKKAKKSEISIWSDDSVEDIMALLPETSRSVTARGQEKVEIFRYEALEPARDLRCASSQKRTQFSSGAKGLYFSDCPSSSGSSVRSTYSSATTFSSSTAQTLDHSVSAELGTLAEKCTYHVFEQHERGTSKVPDKLTSTRLQSCELPIKLSKSQERPMTPLQRLGARTLNHSQSCAGLLSSTQRGSQGNNSTNANSESAGGGHTLKRVPGLPVVRSAEKNATSFEGSEDLIKHDSEDDVSDPAVGGDALPESRLSLGQFCFNG